MPANTSGKHINPVEWNRNDGFSPGQALVRPRARHRPRPRPASPPSPTSGQPRRGRAGRDHRQRRPGAPARTSPSSTPTSPAGSRRPGAVHPPGRQLHQAGHRYIVGMQGMKDAAGATLPAPAAFDRERDLLMADDDRGRDPETRWRPRSGCSRSTPDAAGMATQDLYLAWDFTVASTENTTGRMLHIRDDALARWATAPRPSPSTPSRPTRGPASPSGSRAPSRCRCT